MPPQLLHHDFIDFLLQHLYFLLQRQNAGAEDWFPQRPHFLHLRQFLLLLRTALTSCGNELPHDCIQFFFTNTVRGTGILPVAHIGFADVLYSAAPIPIPVDGNERSSTVTTGKQSRIPMTGSVAFCPLAALFLEQRLCLLPIFSGNDGRVYILVTEPLFFGNFSEELKLRIFLCPMAKPLQRFRFLI